MFLYINQVLLVILALKQLFNNKYLLLLYSRDVVKALSNLVAFYNRFYEYMQTWGDGMIHFIRSQGLLP